MELNLCFTVWMIRGLFLLLREQGILPFIQEKIIDCAEMLNDPWLRGDVGYDSLKYRNVFSQVKAVPPGSMLKYNTSTGHIEIIRYSSHIPESIVSLTTPEFLFPNSRKLLTPVAASNFRLPAAQESCSAGIDSIGVLAAQRMPMWLHIHLCRPALKSQEMPAEPLLQQKSLVSVA